MGGKSGREVRRRERGERKRGWEEGEGIEKQQFSRYSSGVEVGLWNAADDA